MTAVSDHRYCHPCGGEFWSTVSTCPDCGALAVSYPPPADADDAAPSADRSPGEVMEFDLASLTVTERRSLGPWLERAGIAHSWRDGVWLQVGAHDVDESAVIIEHLPPANDPENPAARQTELLDKVFGIRSEPFSAGSSHNMGTISMVTMTIDWLRSKFHRRR